MATLQIRKKAEKVFVHVPSDQAEFIISKFYISIDGLEFQVVEQGQSKRNKYLLSDITVYDDTVGGSAETFTTIEELSERLVALKYNGFYNENESLFNAFTDLVDTPSSYTGQGGKVVAVKSDASGLEFITGGGGGSTPTLQDVLDEGGDYTKTSGTATVTGNKGVYNAGQNSFIENFTIETTDEDVLRTAAFGASKAGYSFSHSVTDLVTGETTSSGLGMNEGVFSLESLVNDGTDESTHRIEFDIDPTLNDTLTLKTPNDEIGEKVFATREWVNSNLPTIDANPTDGSSNAVSSNGVFDALALKVPNAIRVGYTSLTGVTGANVLASILIPANWLNDGESFKVEITNFKSVTAVSVNFAIYHDTVLNGVSNTISNGQQLTSLFRVGGVFYRLMTIDGTTLYNSVSSNAVQQVPAASTAAANTTTFDRTVNNYITVTSNPSVISEVTGFYYLSVTKI